MRLYGKLAALSLAAALLLTGCGTTITGVTLGLPDQMERGATGMATPEYAYSGATPEAAKAEELADKLEAYRSSLSDGQLEEMVEKTKALEAYQESEERPEDLQCIPMLKRSDIRKEVNGFSNEELQVDNSLFLYQDVCTNGIGYVNVMFEICLLYTSDAADE